MMKMKHKNENEIGIIGRETRSVAGDEDVEGAVAEAVGVEIERWPECIMRTICNMAMVDIIMTIIIMNIMADSKEDIMMINTMTNSIMKKKIQRDSHRVVQVVREEDVRRVHAV